ncbi:MAG: LuxR C-terminal-related transcriptional regulator [Nocardioides sp.]
MNTSARRTTAARSHDAAALVVASRTLRDLIDDRVMGGPSPSMRLLGRGMGEISRGLTKLERQARRSIWNMQPTLYYDPEDHVRELNRRSRRRGLDLQTRVPARVITQHPLLPSLSPGLRVAPVQHRVMIVDATTLVTDGPWTPSGDPTAWIFDDPAVVGPALDLWEAAEKLSRPVESPAGGRLLSERQLDIAAAMCLGMKDSAIARHCDSSQRTVEREIASIVDYLGARGRAEAILTMLGRGRNSRSGDAASARP